MPFYGFKKIKLISLNREKQGQKRPLDSPKRMIERRKRERKVEGEIQRWREGERERGERDKQVKGVKR